MIPAWLARLGLGAGASYLKRRLMGEGKEVAGDIRKKILAKIAKERDKYMPEHLKEEAKKVKFYYPVKNAKEAQKFIKDVLKDTGAKKPKPEIWMGFKREARETVHGIKKTVKAVTSLGKKSTAAKKGQKASIGGLKDVLKGARKKSDIIGPIAALGAGGTLKYIKESKKKKSKSKRNRPDLYPPPKKKKE